MISPILKFLTSRSFTLLSMNQSDKYSFFRSKDKLDTQMDVVDSLG